MILKMNKIKTIKTIKTIFCGQNNNSLIKLLNKSLKFIISQILLSNKRCVTPIFKLVEPFLTLYEISHFRILICNDFNLQKITKKELRGILSTGKPAFES